MTGAVDAISDIRGLDLIPRILFATDGAITHILEAYVGEPVDLVRVTSATVSDPAERLEAGFDHDERGLRRKSLLAGRRSGRVFVHSESVVFLDRLPEPVADELVRSGTSLLKLLTGRGIGTFRESIAEWEGTDEHIAAFFGIAPSEIHVARTYQIVVHGRPVARVTESFPKHRFSPGPAT